MSVYDQSYRIPIDTGGIRERFVDETRQKFADAGYALRADEVDILVTQLPCSLFESLFGRVLQPMHGAEPKDSCERPQTMLSCVTCQKAAVVQNVQLAARAELAEADLAWFKSRHTAAGCGMDATTGSLHVTTTGAYCVSDVPNSFDHGEE